jgi:hypothetical protein
MILSISIINKYHHIGNDINETIKNSILIASLLIYLAIFIYALLKRITYLCLIQLFNALSLAAILLLKFLHQTNHPPHLLSFFVLFLFIFIFMTAILLIKQRKALLGILFSLITIYLYFICLSYDFQSDKQIRDNHYDYSDGRLSLPSLFSHSSTPAWFFLPESIQYPLYWIENADGIEFTEIIEKENPLFPGVMYWNNQLQTNQSGQKSCQIHLERLPEFMHLIVLAKSDNQFRGFTITPIPLKNLFLTDSEFK